MKIAVACDNAHVAGHFGHCETFEVYETESSDSLKTTSIPNPGHKPGFLPNFLHHLGVNVVIAGGMGQGAMDIFNEKGMTVIVGASGSAQEVVHAYIQGNLKSTGSLCNEHQGGCHG